jgi:hypothetical protein
MDQNPWDISDDSKTSKDSLSVALAKNNFIKMISFHVIQIRYV